MLHKATWDYTWEEKAMGWLCSIKGEMSPMSHWTIWLTCLDGFTGCSGAKRNKQELCLIHSIRKAL